MHVIISYDVGVERLHKVHILLRRYLNWIQNSSFEGDLTNGQFEDLRTKLIPLLDPGKDSVIVFRTANSKWVSRQVWGKERGSLDAII